MNLSKYIEKISKQFDKSNSKFKIENIIEYVVLAYAFVLPLSRAGISIFTVALFIFWLLAPNLKQRFFIVFNNKVILSVMLFMVFSLISLIWSENITRGLLNFKHYWFILPIFVFATNIKKEQVSKIISAFLLGMLISEITSYGIFLQIWTFGHGTPQDPTPFMNHIHYSIFLAVTSLLLLNRAYFETTYKWKIFYFIYFLFTTSNLFINGGRTGQLGFIIGIFVVGIVNMKNKFVALISILLLVITISTVAYKFSPTFQNRITQTLQTIRDIQDSKSNMYSTSFGSRLGLWIVGEKIFLDHPIIGVGLGSEMNALHHKIDTDMPQFRDTPVYTLPHYHNSYVTYLVQLGFIGFLFFISIFYHIAKLKIDNKQFNNLKFIFLTVFMIGCFFEQIFAVEFPMALFALFIGIFLASSQNNKLLNS